MVLGNTDGLRGHATLRRADRGASDDRKIPTRKSGGGLLANDERPSPISRRAHDVSGVGNGADPVTGKVVREHLPSPYTNPSARARFERRVSTQSEPPTYYGQTGSDSGPEAWLSEGRRISTENALVVT